MGIHQSTSMEAINRTYGPGRTDEDWTRFEELANQVQVVMRSNGWSKKETGRRIGMAEGTFSQWLSGKYQGRLDKHNEQVSTWLDNVDDMLAISTQIPQSPDYIQTSVSNELMNLLGISQVMPCMTVGSFAAGMGKTLTAEKYRSTHANCWIANITPYTKTVHGMLATIAKAVGLPGGASSGVVEAIGERVRRREAPTLLIIDEAQNLIDDAVNQVRHFVDDYQCGVVLLGNKEVYGRFQSSWSNKQQFAQLRSRIFKLVNRERMESADVVAFIKAHGITMPDQIKFLTGVGMKPGALRQVDMTIKLAKMMAAGNEKELELRDLRQAWSSRDVEV